MMAAGKGALPVVHFGISFSLFLLRTLITLVLMYFLPCMPAQLQQLNLFGVLLTYYDRSFYSASRTLREAKRRLSESFRRNEGQPCFVFSIDDLAYCLSRPRL